MQLLGEEEAKRAETRTQLKDDNFLREMHSRLVPGIENSEGRFEVHKFTCAALELPDFSDFERLRSLIDALIAELDPRDFLGCTTALEMLAETAATAPKCVPFFGQIGLLHTVYELFKHTKAEPDMGIIHIGSYFKPKKCSKKCTADADSLTKFPEFTADVFDSVYRFDAFDVTRRQLAFETLAVIGSSSGAKQILSQNESLFSMQRAMSHLAVAVATASEPSLKARHLEAVQMIFDQITVPGSEQKQNSSAAAPDWEEQLLHRWFRWLGEPFPKLLLQCVRDPISEVQMGALRVLMALLHHQWAYPHFCAVNGFIDLLVDRSVANFDADALQLKHALVCRVVDAASPSVNAGQMELLRDYRVKGPFWLTPRMEVATEGAG
uniref:26S proteasome non-ATPase regulatory subunit 5 n=1 Tax=Globodera pallida TaxID=36090 RepID=A0A183CA21_GLOPA